MSTSAIGRRYANALLELANEKKLTPRVQKDLNSFAETWKANAELRAVFENPKISLEAQKKVLTAVLDRLAASPLTKNTLKLLVDRGRLAEIVAIAASFDELASLEAGTVTAEVTSATALPEPYYAQLKAALEASTGKKVILVKKQDPSLIAGIVTRVGDQVIDGSVRTRLNELREGLLSN
ncbi:MAG: ATP synthase F1 subunit delta [Sandaracinaceae bacterium]|nr:ATP synthase F1 subunit delta [Sandaracinaceae bacterium]